MANEPHRNSHASEDILRKLHAVGVRDIVFCAGARNSPLVMALERAKAFNQHSFFEERSAAFFAFGRARREQKPTAVITTSGTAVAELLPAVVEAWHSGVPLLLVTADRPRRLRGTGAPQAIDQQGMFTKFVGLELDIEAGESFSFEAWDGVTPLHLNICFDEPLLESGAPSTQIEFEKTKPTSLTLPWRDSQISEAQVFLQSFLGSVKKPVAIVGTVDRIEDRKMIERFLEALRIPVYLESTSGLRESSILQAQALRSGDRILNWGLKHGEFDSVIRIGGVPTVRVWRDLDDPNCPARVLSVNRLPFAGLSRGDFLHSDIQAVFKIWIESGDRQSLSFDGYATLLQKDREGCRLLDQLYAAEPNAEPSQFRTLSLLVANEAQVYVGNSLPIREWDLMASSEKTRVVEANRGVNGIDGQLSTFLGLIPAGGEGWAVVGDLTALYDLTSPWAMAANPEARVRIVVVNNGGGKIFSRIFKTTHFENRHSLNFKGWAEMWGLGYEEWSSVPKEWQGTARTVIELKPDEKSTHAFWEAYDAFWK